MAKKNRKHTTIYFDLADVWPMTDTQQFVFNSNKNLVLQGSAGTGKSFISCYLAFKDIFLKKKYKKVILVRSAVPTRDMGFLPGDDKEKARIYEEPYKEICSTLFGRGDAYDTLKKHNRLEFMTTSFLRGLTMKDCIIIVDECQNMTLHELDSIVTRMGENSKIIFCGDTRQGDLRKSGLPDFCRILEELEDDFDIANFTTDDIVRSDFVKKYLKAREDLEL